MSLKDEELQRLADDFEAGWSDQRLERAQGAMGPGVIEFLPAYLHERLEERARQDGKNDLEVIQEALKAYLIPA